MDSAPYFTEVFRKFTEWLAERDLGSVHRFAIATDWYAPPPTHTHTRTHCPPLSMPTVLGILKNVSSLNVSCPESHSQTMLGNGLMSENSIVVSIASEVVTWLPC